MNSTKSPESESKSFFPRAEEVSTIVFVEYTKKISEKKSELANYILKEINEFRNSGKPIEIELGRVNHTRTERDLIKKLLYENGWKILYHEVEYDIPNWSYGVDSKEKYQYWKISKRESMLEMKD